MAATPEEMRRLAVDAAAERLRQLEDVADVATTAGRGLVVEMKDGRVVSFWLAVTFDSAAFGRQG